MKAKFTAVASALVTLALAPHALASTGIVTYQGIVNNTQVVGNAYEPLPDVDGADLFGGGNLEGDQITASFSYSTALGPRSGFGDTYDQLVGGISFGTSSPITSATFTIENDNQNYSYTYTPNYYALAYTQSSAAGQGFVEDTAYSENQDQALVAILASDAPASLFKSFSSAIAVTSGSYFDPGATNVANVYDSIDFDTIDVTVSAVPEASTWALMIVGVGLTGIMLRRRLRRSDAPVMVV